MASQHGPATASLPAMSVVVITPNRYEAVGTVLRHLKAQSIKQQIEVVIVAPTTDAIPLDAPELLGFHNVQVVAFAGVVSSTAAARVAGVRAARAPVVAFVEDHSFPQPGWAEALITAYSGPWAAVGPAVGNANPGNAISWANLLIEYAPWLDAATPEAVEHLPGHNSTLHMNYSTMLASIRLRFHAGRIFAAARARSWPIARRLAYGAAAPLIPAVRLRRILTQVRTRRRARLPGNVFPALLMLLVCDAAGEMTGYLMGAGSEAERAGKFEFRADRQRANPKRYEAADS
jgi:hypothetical protein